MAIDENYPGMTEAVVTTLLANIMFKTAWTDAADDDARNLALRAAVEIIERLNYRGDKTSSSQTYQFPRNDDTDVPTDIFKAILHIAIALLDGRDPDFDYENQNLRSEAIAGIRSTHAHNVDRDHMNAGVPSVTAWRHLVPYLRDTNHFSVMKA